ncbi:MAG: iron(III) transport system permease protein, partial [Abditibacteriota bacterium]|nr:iron(III) transport system permease protein [Abditibacteriota bacterium]
QEAPLDRSAQSTLDGRWCTWPSLLIFTVCPLAPIAVFVSQLRPPQVLWETWSANSGELLNTVLSATIATLLSVLLSLLLVSLWRNHSTLRRSGLMVGGALMLVAPVLLGIALIQFYNRPGWEWIYGGGDGSDSLQSQWMDWSSRYSLLIVGYLSRFLPLALWWFDEAANRVDNRLLEAAQNLGAAPGRVTLTILLPYLTPVVVGGSALLWSLCTGELATSILVNAPGGQTLPVPIFNWMHIGAIEQVAALSLALFLLNALALLLGQSLLALLLKPRTTGTTHSYD